jgi:DNA-binding NarL/FixJ family response regulator
MTPNGALSNGGAIRCLIANDQAMVREGFAAMLAAEPGITIAGQAIDGADAVRLAWRLNPDVVLMDVRMPVMDGLEAARQILTATRGADKPRVLMLTTFDLDEYVYEALRAGASGFLLKDATTAELIHAVQVVAAGDALLAPSVTRRLIADFTRKPPAQTPSLAAIDVLTSPETEVLKLIGHGMSNPASSPRARDPHHSRDVRPPRQPDPTPAHLHHARPAGLLASGIRRPRPSRRPGVRPTLWIMLTGLVLSSLVLLLGPLRTLRDLPSRKAPDTAPSRARPPQPGLGHHVPRLPEPNPQTQCHQPPATFRRAASTCYQRPTPATAG